MRIFLPALACLIALPGPAWILLSKTYKPFSSHLYLVFDRLSALADNRLYRHCRYSADTLSALIFYIGTSADIANIGRYILILAEIESYRPESVIFITADIYFLRSKSVYSGRYMLISAEIASYRQIYNLSADNRYRPILSHIVSADYRYRPK